VYRLKITFYAHLALVGGNGFIGGLDKVLLAGITKASVWETIPEALWAGPCNLFLYSFT